MDNQNEEQLVACLNEGEPSVKALAKIGGKLQETTRTIFKLSEHAHKAIQILSERFDTSKREILDNATTIASNKDNQIHWKNDQQNAVRKSYAITLSASKKLSDIAKDLKIPRDMVLESAIWFMVCKISKIKLTSQEKIEIAEQILSKIESFEKEFCGAIGELSELSGPLEEDNDFEEVLSTIGYIQQFYELSLYVQRYIKDKQAQLEIDSQHQSKTAL